MTHTISLGKRLLAAMLAVLLALSALPLPAFAAEEYAAEVTVDGFGPMRYDSIRGAMDGAKNGKTATVKLLRDIDLAEEWDEMDRYAVLFHSDDRPDITLDLNGCEVKNSVFESIFYFEAGTGTKLTLCGSGALRQIGQQELALVSGGELVVDGPALASESSAYPLIQQYGGTIRVKSGLLDSGSNNLTRRSGAALWITGGSTEITGGTVQSYREAAVMMSKGSLSISGDAQLLGRYYARYETAADGLIVEGGTVTLSGGKFLCESADKSGIWCTEDYSGDVTDLLAKGYRYVDGQGQEAVLKTQERNGKTVNAGVPGGTVVAETPVPQVTYVDENGEKQTASGYTALTGDLSSLTEGWYAVEGTVDISNLPIDNGQTVNLILCDGAVLTGSSIGIGTGSTLNIFAQSEGTGRMELYTDSIEAISALGMDGKLNIYGGTVKATTASREDLAGNRERSLAAIGTEKGSLRVGIYGGTVIAQAPKGAAAIGKTENGTGTVNVTIGSGRKVVRTDDPAVAYPYGNTDGVSVTITACTDHAWQYFADGDTHRRYCALCNTWERDLAHVPENYVSKDGDTHRAICACGWETEEAHTFALTPNTDGLTHRAVCTKCGYEGTAEEHSFTEKRTWSSGETWTACACGAELRATYAGRQYALLERAMKAAGAENGTVVLAVDSFIVENVRISSGNVTVDLNGKTWRADITGSNRSYMVPLTVFGGSVTLKNGKIEQGSSTSTSNAALLLAGGHVTIAGDVTLSGGKYDRDTLQPAIDYRSGTLKLETGVVLRTGMTVPKGRTLAEFLPEGTAFVDPDTGGYVPGVYTENDLRVPMAVRQHTHDFSGGTCPCGLDCSHEKVDLDTGKCELCQAQAYEVRLTHADGSREGFRAFRDGWTAAMEADDSTLTMLCSVEFEDTGTVLTASSGKFTLDLNGFTLKAPAFGKLLQVGGTADLTLRGGTLEDSVYLLSGTQVPESSANALVLEGGSVTLENMTLQGGYGPYDDLHRCYAVIVYDGTLRATNCRFIGGATVFHASGEAHPALYLSKAILENGLCYAYVGAEREPNTLRGFFADGELLLDGNGKYIDLNGDGYWETESDGEMSITMFTYEDPAQVVPHSHTFEDGICTDCGYGCPHNGGSSREASYFQRAVCAICGSEYGDYVRDTTPPTLTVTGDAGMEDLDAEVNFDTYFNRNVAIHAFGTDDSYSQPGFQSGRDGVTISFLRSDRALSMTELENGPFVTLGRKDRLDVTSLEEGHWVYYFRVTDAAGNRTYARTKGFTIDKTAPVLKFTEPVEKTLDENKVYSFCGWELHFEIQDGNPDKVEASGSSTFWDYKNGTYTIYYRENERDITLTATDKAGNQTVRRIRHFEAHDFDPDTGICRNCGMEAVAKVVSDQRTGWFTDGDGLFDGLNEPIYGGATVTLLKDTAITETKDLPYEVTIDLNGKSLTGPVNSGLTVSYKATILSSDGVGTSNLAIALKNEGTELTMGQGLGQMGQLLALKGTLKVYSGDYLNLATTVGRQDWYQVNLYGGSFSRVTAKSCSALPAESYRFEGLNYEEADKTELLDVRVIPCTHAPLNEENYCSDCGQTFVAKIVDENGSRYFAYLQDAADVAAKENATVTLLVTIAQDLDIRGGSCTIDADAHSLQGQVCVNGNAKLTLKGRSYKNLTIIVLGELVTDQGWYLDVTLVGKQFRDCLPEGVALADLSNNIVDARIDHAENLIAVSHPTHNCQWNQQTHEKACACGYVSETDFEAPIIEGAVDGGVYYGCVQFWVHNEKEMVTVTTRFNSVMIYPGAPWRYSRPGPIHIMVKDVAGNFTSLDVLVKELFDVSLPRGEGYTVTGEGTVGQDLDYTFTVNIRDGYSRTDSYKVTANGVELTPTGSNGNSDTYVVPAVTEKLNIAVTGVADMTPPELELTLSENRFTGFLNRLTFGLFFKTTQTLQITARDAGSGLQSVEYLLTEEPFTQETAVTGDWQNVQFDMYNQPYLSLQPGQKGFLYVRAMDWVGNVTIVNTDGIVIYTDVGELTESVTTTLDRPAEISLELNGNTVRNVFLDDVALGASAYSLAGETLTVSAEAVNAAGVGTHTLRLTFDPLGEAYVEKTGNEAPAERTCRLIIGKKTATLTLEPMAGKTYDGQPLGVPAYTTDSDGTVRIEYKRTGEEDFSYTTMAPKTAGRYTVRIRTAESDTYLAASAQVETEILPRDVTIRDVQAASREYDGTTDLTITDPGTLDGKIAEDDLTIRAGTAALADKNAGNGKTVTFTGFAITGADAENYRLTGQPAPGSVDIAPRTLTVTGLAVADKEYDGTNAAKLAGTPALAGLVDGEQVTLICGTPTFDQTGVGENIPVSFTKFALFGDPETLANYALRQPTGLTASILAHAADGSEYTVNSNDWLNTDFLVTAKTGYLLSLTDTADGDWREALTAGTETNAGRLTFYVKNTATGVISTAVTETYKIDKTAPTGTVALNGRTAFQTFLNKITFGLFFREDVTVDLTAQDGGSGVKTVSYFQSDKILTLEQVQAVTGWTEGKNLNIEAEDMAQFIIYVRLEDNAGNVGYIGSDGAIFDTTAPEIIGVEDGKTYYVTKRAAADDENLDAVTLNGQPVTGAFTLDGDRNAAYVIRATDLAGNVTVYTVEMRPISDLTAPIRDLTEENVTAADAGTIERVERQILDIAETFDEDESTQAEWDQLVAAAARCRALTERIAAIRAELERLTAAAAAYDVETVTSADEETLEQLLADIQTLLDGQNLTNAQRADLEALRDTVRALLDRIAAARAAATAEEIRSVEGITKENVSLKDKEPLEKAEKALVNALETFEKNYTEAERQDLETRLAIVREALAAIRNAQAAAEAIDKLPAPEQVKLTDEDAVRGAKKQADALTDREKELLGKAALDKLDALLKRLEELKKPTTPATGDPFDPVVWTGMMFFALAAAAYAAMNVKRSKNR